MGASDGSLLTAMAEDLKLPLLQIARSSELIGMKEQQRTAEMAMRLIDGYILGLQTDTQMNLELEPVTLSSVLYDVAEELVPLAKQAGYELEIAVSGKLGPVMGNRRVLQHAFTLLGYELLQAAEDEEKPRFTLATHGTKGGVVAGVYTNNTRLTSDAMRRARALVGSAHQILPVGSASNGAGIFIADNLIKSLASTLRVTRYHKQAGLAATFLQSQQLKLV